MDLPVIHIIIVTVFLRCFFPKEQFSGGNVNAIDGAQGFSCLKKTHLKANWCNQKNKN